MKEPKIEFGTKDQLFWTEIKETTEQDIERLEKMLRFNKAVVAMAKEELDKINRESQK